jgi:hypothetical protein
MRCRSGALSGAASIDSVHCEAPDGISTAVSLSIEQVEGARQIR